MRRTTDWLENYYVSLCCVFRFFEEEECGFGELEEMVYNFA